MDLDTLLKNWIVDAKTTVQGGFIDTADYSIPSKHVFDLRSATDFANGHIKGAINVTLANVVTKAKELSTTKPILVVCYTGQTAGQAVMALRLSGFKTAQVLKWGMACWNPQFSAVWTNAQANIADANPNWVTSAPPVFNNYGYPSWTSNTSDPASLLAERVNATLAGGLKTVSAATVLATPANYDIVNYWPLGDYTSIGHFTGAFQQEVITIHGNEIAHFNPAKETILYCYTGQTSSMATFYLNMLGYNTKGVSFGVNALKYDALKAANKPVFKTPNNFPFVTGS
jgi:rhodanese-related sulfurtransferase